MAGAATVGEAGAATVHCERVHTLATAAGGAGLPGLAGGGGSIGGGSGAASVAWTW